jgi:hypothetical protein
MAALAEPIANVASMLSPELPEYCVNENDELMLPHPVYLIRYYV